MQRSSWSKRAAGFVAVVATVVASALVATPAQADTAPVDPAEPTTVTADSLPTAQIDGVVWNQQIVGNTVYVGGNFQKVRPAGAAAGTNETTQPYLFAYNLTTGARIASFAPALNGQVRDLALSPDGTRLYVAGNFTTIDGQNRYRLAAFDTATAALVPTFRPTINAPLVAVTATDTAVYFAGTLTSVNSVARLKVAGVKASDGSTLPFNAAVDNGSVTAIVAAPDGNSVVIGGSFTSVAGSSNPGYGLARLAATDGSLMPLPVNTYIRNGGADSAVLSLETDGTSFYGSGYHFGGGGNMEGSFSASWATGAMNWVEDGHGDTYSVFPAGDAVYSASHKHYCGNTGGFPQTDPWSFYRATATSKSVAGTNTPDIYGYPDHAGQPAPKFRNWFPVLNTGTFTGKTQGPWTVNGNDSYVLMGGEFTTVNSVGQQGLARFAKSNLAPNTQGPRLGGAQWPLKAISLASGQVRLAWPQNYDRDNATLTYNLYRTTVNSAPIYTTTLTAPFWKQQSLGFVDKNLTPGSTQKYRIEAIDAFGNVQRSEYVDVTVSSSGAASAYSDAVLDSGASSFWRLGEPSGTAVFDWAGFSDAVAGTGVTRGAAGAIGNDTNTASTFSGNSDGLVASQSAVQGPQTFSIETWFKTTSTSGGKIVGFGNANTGNSSSYDRHIYMTASGKVVFGVYPNEIRTVQSPASYNDGVWHQAVATLGPDGQKLYVDGKRVAQRSDTTSAQSYSGYWRIGGDSPWEGNAYFAGSIDDVSIYNAPLTAIDVNSHWVAAGRTSTIPVAPADAYGAAVFNLGPDLYWRLNDANGSSTAVDSGPLGNAGDYRGAVTYQVSGGITGSDKAVTLPSTGGTHGLVVAKNATNNPSVYSEEIWFKTSTTNGGKLIGFGDQTSGTSSNYDRHVYMENDGRLTFGVWTGTTNTITTTASYNDDAWHQVVATQSSDGMKLYVDGVLRGTHPQTAAQAYTGYWRIGGDTTWGPQPWFDGSLDEAAVYPIALTSAQVAQHWQLGSGANLAPVAAFTSSVTDLKVDLDGSTSSDPDGSIAGYAWAFGDGDTGTGATPSHTYATPGTKTVTLTVTDNRGGTATVSHDVEVTAPNLAPTASFSAVVDGMKVSVDGSASSDSDGSVASYAWTFGDGATATGATPPDHTYASGGTKTITLKVTDDDGATDTATRTVDIVAPNQPPHAAFTTSIDGLTVTANGTSSTDADGEVASYSWSFDGGPAVTGPTASKTFAGPGTYTVKLTVTDDDGATDSLTKSVVVTVNSAPTARFTSTVDALGVTVNGTTSSDTDGSVASYAWEFGDGATKTGSTANHSYAAAGTYTVKLTVTDNEGATDSVTHDVTVTAPTTAQNVATDSFGRNVSSGWGTADLGGAWTVTGGASRFSVDGAVGKHTNAAGITTTSVLNSVSTASTDLLATVSADKVPNGGGAMVTLQGRRAANGDAYAARLKFYADGAVQLHLAQPSGTLTGGTVPGLTYAAGDKLRVRLQVEGATPTTIRAKVWRVGSAEPASWFATTTDSAAANLQAAGAVGITTYVSASATNGPVVFSYDDLAVTTIGPAAPNQAPHAAFDATTSALSATVDGGASSDPDGTVSSYAWNFGDGGTDSGTAPTSSHTYSTAGTYTITLKVTDNRGGTDTVSHDVTVSAPPADAPLAQDAFTRSVTGGWGSAATGGPWSITGTASRFSVGGGVGRYTLPGGATVGSQLTGVSSTSTRTEVSISLDKALDGSGAYVHVQGRRVAADNYYGARVRYMGDGTVQLHVTRGNGSAVAGVVVPGLTVGAGDTLRVVVEVTGTSPTTVRAKLWKVGATEPTAWQTSTTDTTASLQVPGSVGLIGYLYANVTTAPVVISFDDFVAKAV